MVLTGIAICAINNYERIQHWIEPSAEHHLTYNDFSEFCNNDVNSYTNALADIGCSQLIGQSIQWDGYVKTSKVVSVNNPVLTVLSFFPKVNLTWK